jgi:hypothetical protein
MTIMAQMNTPKGRSIDQIVKLMDETGINLADLVPEVFVNWDNADVLELFPVEIIEKALTYLRYKKAEQEEELDLSQD